MKGKGKGQREGEEEDCYQMEEEEEVKNLMTNNMLHIKLYVAHFSFNL